MKETIPITFIEEYPGSRNGRKILKIERERERERESERARERERDYMDIKQRQIYEDVIKMKNM